MAETQPRGEQLRFLSAKTGTHNLDTYLENAERGSRSIGDMLGDIFDSSGNFDETNFEFQFDPSDNQLEVRVGGSSNSYTNITNFFNIRGTYSSSSTTYKNFDLITRSNGDVHIVHGLASSSATTTFADDAAVASSSNTTKIVDVSGAATQASAAATSATNAANSATAAASSATAASTSESNASSSASSASTSASTATTKASEAATSATNAATSETNAATSATNAASSATSAAASYDDFDDRYLGAKSSNPSTDNDGNALIDGALFFDTTNNVMKVYDLGGTAWLQLTPSSSDQTAINAVNANASNINTVASQNSNITTLAGISSDITSVANISSDVAAVENKLTEIQAVADDLAEASSEIDVVAQNITNVNNVGNAITNVNNVGGSITNVNTVASNISGVNSFADRYRISSSAPSTSLDVGDLYFDTTADELKVYKSGGWAAAGSTVNGTSARFKFVATSNQTTFTGNDANGVSLAYDSGYIDVYLNGVHLDPSDYTATSGTSIVLGSGAATNDELYVVAFGTFNVASMNADNLSSGTVPDARFPATLPAISGANLTNLDASDLASGTVPIARLGSSGTKDATTFLRGDNTFAVVDTTNASNLSTGTLPNARLSSVPNSALANSSITINGDTVSLGGTINTGTNWDTTAKTGNFNAAVNDAYFIDTTSNTVTATLPSSANAGEEVRFLDISGTFDTNNFTVGRNGHKIQGDASDLIVSTERAGFALVYVNATQGWLLKDR